MLLQGSGVEKFKEVFDDRVMENEGISFGVLAEIDKCYGGVRVYATKKTFVLDVCEWGWD